MTCLNNTINELFGNYSLKVGDDYMIKKEPVRYYLFNETTVDEETTLRHREILHENIIDTPGGKLWTLTWKQVLQSFGVRNWNGRIYDKDIVMKALDTNPLIQNDIKSNAWCGEYGHPIIEKGMNELARQMTMFPPNICWKINKYWAEGNLLLGEVTSLSGGYGDMLRDRIITGLPAMASSRAIGGVDKNGHVLAGYQIVTFDAVVRCSHKEAMEVPGTQQVNTFQIPTGNTMTESAVAINPIEDSGFADFLLSESSSKQQINMLCDTFKLDYDSMVITESAVKFTRVDGLNKTTINIPLRNLINAEYYNLF